MKRKPIGEKPATNTPAPRQTIRSARKNLSTILNSAGAIALGRDEYSQCVGFIVGVEKYNPWDTKARTTALTKAIAAFHATCKKEMKND